MFMMEMIIYLGGYNICTNKIYDDVNGKIPRMEETNVRIVVMVLILYVRSYNTT